MFLYIQDRRDFYLLAPEKNGVSFLRGSPWELWVRLYGAINLTAFDINYSRYVQLRYGAVSHAKRLRMSVSIK